MIEAKRDPSERWRVLIEAEGVELLREVRNERQGRLHARVFAVHHPVIGYMLLIKMGLEGDGEPTGPEVVSARDLFARTLDWVEKNGREIVAEESKRHMPEWRRPFNPEWDA